MGSLCGGNTQTTTSQQSTTPTNLAGLQSIFGQVQNAAQTPFTPFTGESVAPVNDQQRLGIAGVNDNATTAQPYYSKAADFASTSGAPISADAIQHYINPFTSNVIDATKANFAEDNGQAQNSLKAKAAMSGALGGSGQGVAQAELVRQQQLAQAPVIAQLQQKSYEEAVQAAQADRAAAGTAAGTFSNIGTAAQRAGIEGAGAQINAGTLEQQTQQQKDAADYRDYLQRQAFPYQSAQFAAQYGTPAALAQGTSTSGTQTAPGPNPWVQAAGLGLSAAAAFSDERVKEGKEVIGKTFDGQPIYKFRYKGSPLTQIGLMAQDVEHKHPSAVGESSGIKTVDYDQATDAAANKGHFASGGGVSPFDFIHDAVGYVPIGGNAPQATLPQPQLKFADPQKTDMSPITSGLNAIGKSGGVKNPFSISGSGGWGATDTGAEGVGSIGGLYSHGGLVEAIHHIHKAIKHSRGGSVGNSPFQTFAAGGPVRFADGGSLDDRFNSVQEAIADGSFDPVGKNSTTFDTSPAPFRLDRSAAAPQGAAPSIVPAPQASPMRAASLPPQITGVPQDDSEPSSALAFDSAPRNSPLSIAPQASAEGAAQPSGSMGGFNPLGLSDKLRQSLIAGGLGVAASRSPFALSAIGEGGLHGLKNYSDATAAEREVADKKITHDQAAQRILREIEAQKETTRHNKATEAKEFKPTWGVIGKDPNTGFDEYGWVNPNKLKVTDAQGKDYTPIKAKPDAVDADGKPLSGDAYASTLPANRATIARGIANYTINPLSLSTKGGHREQALADAARIDPTFDSVNYAARAKAVRDFATGKHGDTTRSLNVAIDHLGTLDEAAKALGNGDSKFINSIRNKWRDQTGSELPGNFAAVRSIVGDEVVKAVIGAGGGALGDREEIKHNIDAQKSPEALAGIIKQYKKLMAGQLHGIQQQYENTTGLRNFHERLSPTTIAELNAASASSMPTASANPSAAAPKTETKTIGSKTYVRRGDQWFEQ